MKKILLIEDDYALCDIIAKRLEYEGYKLVSSSEEYDVVILDYGADDYKLYDLSKLIVISGLRIDYIKNFLIKPFKFAKLIKMIESIPTKNIK